MTGTKYGCGIGACGARTVTVAIDVHIVPTTAPATAGGECPVPVISPAVVNALARLTGKRTRALPLATI